LTLLRTATEVSADVSIDRSTGVNALGAFLGAAASSQWNCDVLATERIFSELETRSPFPPPHRGGAAMLVVSGPAADAGLTRFRR
jgi:hypothetical protein